MDTTTTDIAKRSAIHPIMGKPTGFSSLLFALLPFGILFLQGCQKQPSPLPLEPIGNSPRLDSISFLQNAAIAYFNQGIALYRDTSRNLTTLSRPVSGSNLSKRPDSAACAYFTRAQEINSLLPDTLQYWFIRDAAKACSATKILPHTNQQPSIPDLVISGRLQNAETNYPLYLTELFGDPNAEVKAKGLRPARVSRGAFFSLRVPGNWKTPLELTATAPGYQLQNLTVQPADFSKEIIISLRKQPKCYETLRAEGIALMDQKNYDAAAKKFTTAAQCSDVPTTGNDLPGLLEQAGKLAFGEQQRIESEKNAEQKRLEDEKRSGTVDGGNGAPNIKKMLRAGTSVSVRTDQNISSKDASTGLIVPLKVNSNVTVNGVVVIRAGARVEGRIRSVSQGNLLKPASIVLEILNCEAIDGQRVALRSVPIERKAEGSLKEAIIEQGTVFQATILQDADFDEGDDDDDGVPNKNDQCPREKGPAENKGCPVAPSERAGLATTLAEIEKNMVSVPGGSFQMGCDKKRDGDCRDDEKLHTVRLNGFAISKYEVTQAQWQAVMGENPSRFKDCDNCPVEQVSWEDAQVFIQKLNALTGKKYRLPTEAEWEYAARGGGSSRMTMYSGSNNLDEMTWYGDNSDNKTHPVGAKKANELGLFDMSGNVWEWCSDWYDEKYYSDKKVALDNPQGPDWGTGRVDRGGGWFNYARHCRVAYRSFDEPVNRYNFIGFRLALARQ